MSIKNSCMRKFVKAEPFKKHSCPKCGKGYETQGKYYKLHIQKCTGSVFKKPSRPKITGAMRLAVWETYIGQRTKGKCFCCWKTEITQLSNYKTFHAGHIISDHNGGETSVENMLPICRDCNMNMGSTNWDEYVLQNNLPLRRCGKDPPIAKYIKGIIWWQSLIRMWLERKRTNSYWRQQWKKRVEVLKT